MPIGYDVVCPPSVASSLCRYRCSALSGSNMVAHHDIVPYRHSGPVGHAGPALALAESKCGVSDNLAPLGLHSAVCAYTRLK